MAHNFCQHCGTKLTPEVTVCPNCGAPVPRDESTSEQSGYTQKDANQGTYYRQDGSQGNGYYNQNGYNQGGMYTPPQPPVKRPLDAAMVILSIVNIVFGCCGIGMVLGIIALVFNVQAQNVATDYEYASKLKTARILNIIGIVLVVVSVIFSYVFMNWYMELIETILAEGMAY